MRSILITNCRSGIGLELVKELLSMKRDRPQVILAVCAQRELSQELVELEQQHESLHVLELDLLYFNGYPDFAKTVGDIVGDKGLNTVFLNASLKVKTPRNMQQLTAENLKLQFKVNVMSPILLVKVLLPLLKKSVQANATKPFGVYRAAVVYMSSVYGSIKENTTGGLWGFRESKAAGNMAMRNMTAEFSKLGIATLILVPGNKTIKGSNSEEAPTRRTAEMTAKEILPQMLRLTLLTNGCFLQHNGTQVPW